MKTMGSEAQALTYLRTEWYFAPRQLPEMAILSTALSAAEKRDRSIFSRIASGDSDALRLLYNQTSARAMAIALRILRSNAEAEEVVQEVYLQVWRSAERYDAKRGSAAAFVSTITRTRAIDRLRSKGTADRTAQAAADDSEVGPQHPPTPLEEATSRREREQIQAALEELPSEQREVIELAYFGGFTQREIAEQSGQPLGTVKSRIRLGMERLAKLLETHLEAEA